MSVMEPLKREMIKQYLEGNELKFMCDQDGGTSSSSLRLPTIGPSSPSVGRTRGLRIYAVPYLRETFPGRRGRSSRSGEPVESRWPKAVVGAKVDSPTVRVWTELQLP